MTVLKRRTTTVLAVVVLATILAGGAFEAWSAGWLGTSRHLSDAEEGTSQTGAPVAGSGISGLPTTSWVRDENAKRGTSDWRLDPKHTNDNIEGFADSVSAVQGQTVRLYISTKAPAYQVAAYRMGYYGGQGGREVWRSARLFGKNQSGRNVDPATHEVSAPWLPALSLTVDKDWPQGDYLFKLTSSRNDQQYIPLTVRDDSSKAAYLMKNSVTTWQAYNLWGGYDLYSGVDGRGSSFAKRARVVSFDRPYKIGDGSGDFLGNEFPLVSLVESLGLDVSYTTDVDFHQRPELLLQHKALLSLGHDEYWSGAMRKGATTGRDNGVNIAFLGANADFRHIRFARSKVGVDRREIDYKSSKEDPLNGVDNADVTVDWRFPPVNRPESVLNGNYYECNPVKAAMVIEQPNSWLFAGINLERGATLKGIVGSEYDHWTPEAPKPPAPVEVFAHSPVKCHDLLSHSDVTYYAGASGAGVFDSGTSAWVPALGWDCNGVNPCPKDVLVRATENLLRLFGKGPAGNVEQSTQNLRIADEQVQSAKHATQQSPAVTAAPAHNKSA